VHTSFITAGLLAGVSQAKNSTPEFGHGSSAYGRYYWQAVGDQAVGNYAGKVSIKRQDEGFY